MKKKAIYLFFFYCISISVLADNAANFQRLMVKAEIDFNTLFLPAHSPTLYFSGATSEEDWVFRNYTETGVLVGIRKGQVYILGGPWSEVTLLGSLISFIKDYIGYDQIAEKIAILKKITTEDNPCFKLPLVATGTRYLIDVTANNRVTQHFVKYLQSDLTRSQVTTTSLKDGLVAEIQKKYHLEQDLLLLDELITKLPVSATATDVTKEIVYQYSPAIDNLQKLCTDSTWSTDVNVRRIDDRGNDTQFKLAFSGEVVRMESVTVPAGQFATIVVNEVSESDEGEVVGNTRSWFDIQTGVAVKVEERDEFGEVTQTIEINSFQ